MEPSSTTISSQSRKVCRCTDSIASRTTVARFHSGITMLTSGVPSGSAVGIAPGSTMSRGASGLVRGASRQPDSLRQRRSARSLAAATSPSVVVGPPAPVGSTDSGVARSSQPTSGPSRCSAAAGSLAARASRSTSGCGEALRRARAWLRYQSSGLRSRGGRPNRGSTYSMKNSGCGETSGASR